MKWPESMLALGPFPISALEAPDRRGSVIAFACAILHCSANKSKIIPIVRLEEISSQYRFAGPRRAARASLLRRMW
jgi:hypothetical protein